MADQREGPYGLDGIAPPGMEHVVKKLKEKPGVENPFAIAWKLYNEQKGECHDLDDAALDDACERYRQAQTAGTLLAEYELAAAGVGAAQAILLGQALGQALPLYREHP
jgi:hypothetical protein